MLRSKNPDYDLVALGGGTAGLVIGIFGAQLGARVAIVEADRLGGECTWTGCVPSKALIASANVAAMPGRTEEYGLPPAGFQGEIDLERVLDRMREEKGVSLETAIAELAIQLSWTDDALRNRYARHRKRLKTQSS